MTNAIINNEIEIEVAGLRKKLQPTLRSAIRVLGPSHPLTVELQYFCDFEKGRNAFDDRYACTALDFDSSVAGYVDEANDDLVRAISCCNDNRQPEDAQDFYGYHRGINLNERQVGAAYIVNRECMRIGEVIWGLAALLEWGFIRRQSQSPSLVSA